eukprot:15352755-Ditylum_brightwellii.AAC.1
MHAAADEYSHSHDSILSQSMSNQLVQGQETLISSRFARPRLQAKTSSKSLMGMNLDHKVMSSVNRRT